MRRMAGEGQSGDVIEDSTVDVSDSHGLDRTCPSRTPTPTLTFSSAFAHCNTSHRSASPCVGASDHWPRTWLSWSLHHPALDAPACPRHFCDGSCPIPIPWICLRALGLATLASIASSRSPYQEICLASAGDISVAISLSLPTSL